jgi:hypothetical protein
MMNANQYDVIVATTSKTKTGHQTNTAGHRIAGKVVTAPSVHRATASQE